MSGSDNKLTGSNATDAFGSSADGSFNTHTDTDTTNVNVSKTSNESKTVTADNNNTSTETKTVTADNGNTTTSHSGNDSGNTSTENINKTITAHSNNDNGNTSNKTVTADNGNTSTVNVAKDSGNTHTDDSNNTHTIDSNNTLNLNKDVGNTSTHLDNSGNTSSENHDSFNTHTEADSYSHNNGSFDNTWNTTTTTISTSIGNDISHSFNGYDNAGGTTLVMPEDISQSLSGSANSLAIALDQVNELVSNNQANGDWVQNSASDAIDSHDLSANGGDANHNAGTDNMSSNASGAANLDAFTQSIVLGANLQNNSFSLTVSGHDSLSDGSSIHHSHA